MILSAAPNVEDRVDAGSLIAPLVVHVVGTWVIPLRAVHVSVAVVWSTTCVIDAHLPPRWQGRIHPQLLCHGSAAAVIDIPRQLVTARSGRGGGSG